MLPLWIIDLTDASDRRLRFQELLGQTWKVLSKQDGETTEGEFCWYYTSYDSFLRGWLDEASNGTFSNGVGSIFDFTDYDSKKVDLKDRPGSEEAVDLFCEAVYAFQNALVKDGFKFVEMIRKSYLNAYTTLNICVLGDATQERTQLLFSSVALLLQKEKGRMLANHVHQGMSIMGALFVPSGINNDDVANRERVLRTLMEVDVQRQVKTIRGYDHMLLYQDVQNRFEKYYTLLDEGGQAEFLYQCLIHLYYASNIQHPLISGVAASDAFYLSMGAASVAFDEGNQDKETSCEVANRLLDEFYLEPQYADVRQDDEERKEKKMFIPFESIDLSTILKTFSPGKISIEKELPELNPHPIADFAHKFLKSRYYCGRLVTRLAEFRRVMNDEVETSTKAKLEWVHAAFNNSLGVLQNDRFPNAIAKFVEKCNSSDGGLFWLDSQLKNLKDEAGRNRKRIHDYLEEYVWNNVHQMVEKKYSDAFDGYHSAYKQDMESRTVGHHCEEMKSAAIDDLCNHMKQETPVLSRIARAFLLGVVSVLFLLPVLNFLSPHFLNLGNIRKTSYLWAVFIFMIPAATELFYAIRYIIKKARKIRKLRAYYLHDAYARMANRIEAESRNYYDKLMQLCDLYLQRSEDIRKDINDIPVPEKLREELPITRFNQPLIGGKFRGKELLSEKFLEPKMIYIAHQQKLAKGLYPDDYYSLIHLFKDDFIRLFDGIKIPEIHPVEKEKGTGTVRLVSAAEVKEIRRKEWEAIASRFMNDLPQLIEHELVPLNYPSACKMLKRYHERTGSSDVLKPFIWYAAPNGEFVTSADHEQVDLKTQDGSLQEMMDSFFPDGLLYQSEPGGEDEESRTTSELYKKYVFLTRWDAYDNLALNRILPMEDFDLEEQKRQVNEKERDNKKKDAKSDAPVYPIAASSAILWSLCEGDNSVQWLRLFHSLALPGAREKADRINQKLTTKD